jgi:hypothetical protein
MNKRIQELIGLAQKEVWGNNPYNGSPEFEGYELDAEKFAELIVYDFLSELTNDDALGEARIATIKRLAQKWGVARARREQ